MQSSVNALILQNASKPESENNFSKHQLSAATSTCEAHPKCKLINGILIRKEHLWSKQASFPFIIDTIAHSPPQFTIPQSLLFHVQLWNSHPARRHLTPALTIYGNCPKNTDVGSHTAIFANSVHKNQHSHERPSAQQAGVLNFWAFTGDLITRQCHDFSNYFTSKTKSSGWDQKPQPCWD